MLVAPTPRSRIETRRDDARVNNHPGDLGDAYVFVRADFFMAAHNYSVTRRFVGAGFGGVPVMLLAEDEPGAISPFAMAKLDDRIEREGELIRRGVAANHCSRLGGVFVFAELGSCQRASDLYGWDLMTVRAGRAFGAWRAYDMQIVSVLRSQGLPVDTRHALWRHYWAGEPGSAFEDWGDLLFESPNHREPLWEWLVDGFVHFEPDDRSPFDSRGG
jgi:hypothetical protein